MIYLPDQTTKAVITVGVGVWRISNAESSIAETGADDSHERGGDSQTPQR